MPHLGGERVCVWRMVMVVRLCWSLGDRRSVLRILVQKYPRKCQWGMVAVDDCFCWLGLVDVGIDCEDYQLG